jgi:hypothetical protein
MTTVARLLALSVLIVFTVHADPPVAAARIEGRVIKLTGDFMPGPEATQGKRTPLAVPVHVFRGKLQPFAEPNAEHPQLVAIVQSDAAGTFSVTLPAAGTYTMIAVIDGKMYLNTYDGEMNWSSIEVKADAVATWIIEDSSAATF